MDDRTFAKALINNNSTILLLSQESGGGKTKIWRRFPQLYLTDYFYMETYSWDAMVFKPQKAVTFHGFGIMTSYHDIDMEYRVSWAIDDEPNEGSQEGLEWKVSKDEADPEKKWFHFYLKDVGANPIKVSEGQRIHCLVKVVSSSRESRRCRYGYNGYKNEYEKLEDQDFDFTTDYSSFNGNCTSESWG